MDRKDSLVVAEIEAGQVSPVSLQLLGKARQLAQETGGRTLVMVLGKDLGELAAPLLEYGADEVILADQAELEVYRTLPYTRLVTRLIQERRPNLVLMGATSTGRDLAPRVAARLGTGLTADCLDLSLDPDGHLLQTKPSYGDNIMVDIIIPDHRPQMATVRPNVFALPEKLSDPAGTISRLEAKPLPLDLNTLVKEIIVERQAAARLEDADLVICGGRGLGSRENFQRLYDLAQVLGATVSGTRPALDEGWIQEDFQIGQSGKMIAPKLLITFGVSGAVQFTVGIEKVKTLIAIDQDPKAPIFDFAHYGLLADVNELIPALLKELAFDPDPADSP